MEESTKTAFAAEDIMRFNEITSARHLKIDSVLKQHFATETKREKLTAKEIAKPHSCE